MRRFGNHLIRFIKLNNKSNYFRKIHNFNLFGSNNVLIWFYPEIIKTFRLVMLGNFLFDCIRKTEDTSSGLGEKIY